MLAEHEIRHILVDLRAAVGCLVKRRSTASNGCTRIPSVAITSFAGECRLERLGPLMLGNSNKKWERAGTLMKH